LVAAGYCLYSATTVLVLTLGSGVHGFTLDSSKSSNQPTSSSSLTPPPSYHDRHDPKTSKKDLRTLQRFLEVECWKLPQIRSLDCTLLAVSDACKQINRIVQRAQTDDLYGAALDPSTGLELEANIQGESQQQLDVLCNTIMLRAFCGTANDAVCAVASEEEPLPRSCADVMGYDVIASNNPLVVGGKTNIDGLTSSSRGGIDYGEGGGEFVAVFDPIDGSKNIDSSLPVGTVFGIYRRPEGGGRQSAKYKSPDGTYDLDGFLQRGTNLVAAGYCLYSATTVLVLTLGSGVHGFTLDPDRQIFLQTHPNMRIPDVGSLYSFNEANSRDYSEPVQKFLKNMKSIGKIGGKKVTARYVGALVADVHNVLINGGIYGYPATRDNPNGKLRLLYESAPMAMIMEQAGGAGSTGFGRILDVLPPQPKRRKVTTDQEGATSMEDGGSSSSISNEEEDNWDEEAGKGIHVRVPTFLGSVENVFELDQFHKYYGEDGG
jgi:fructose-1,6-bisphosphatase I